VRLGILRGSDVLTLQPRTNRFSDAVHAEGSCTLSYRRIGRSGKALLAFSPHASLTMSSRQGCPLHTPYHHLAGGPAAEALGHQLTQIATSRNELECGKAAIAMPIFYGGGRVAPHRTRHPRYEQRIQAAVGALSVACHSLSRQLATEIRVTGHETPARPTAKGQG